MIVEIEGATPSNLSSFSETGTEKDSSQVWRRAGQFAFFSLSLIACSAVFSLRKKRQISVQNNGLAQLPPMPQLNFGNDLPEYSQLSQYSAQDAALVFTVIDAMKITNLGTLLAQKQHLEKCGEEIEKAMHTFQFLEIIFRNAVLRERIKTVFRDTDWLTNIKKSEFLNGIQKQMEKYAKANRINCYVKGFAEKMGVPPDEIGSIIGRRDWDALLRYLCQRAAPQEEQRSQE